MSFKYEIGDVFKFGVMEDRVVAQDVISGANRYTLETISGTQYFEWEDHLASYVSMGRFIYVPRVTSFSIPNSMSEWIGDYYHNESNDFNPIDNKPKTCNCTSRDLLHFGCKCGYMDKT